MSGETYDIAVVEREALRAIAAIDDLFNETEHRRQDFKRSALRQLALVRAVRAAKVLNDTPASVNNWKALDAALAPFTDSNDSAESDKRGAQGAEQREGRCDGE